MDIKEVYRRYTEFESALDQARQVFAKYAIANCSDEYEFDGQTYPSAERISTGWREMSEAERLAAVESLVEGNIEEVSPYDYSKVLRKVLSVTSVDQVMEIYKAIRDQQAEHLPPTVSTQAGSTQS